jgi:hypothetical protein
MDEWRPVAMPMAVKRHRRKSDEEACDRTIYKSMIGSLVYAITAIQPDIPKALGVLSQYNPDPSNEYMVPLTCILWYLNSTKD